ncbi:hypothetical protein ABW20_dc0103112 [Dactylellina cionopaga]|nr:hypothetical protein ABW20_dc0103112 [Dactylellina cionopaga]
MNADPDIEAGLRSGLIGNASSPGPREHSPPQDNHITEKDAYRGPSAAIPSLASDEVGEIHLRGLVGLLQCGICNKILRQPLALPCGETLCRSCVPPAHERRNVSYPNDPTRIKGFICPFKLCEGQEHSVADCNLDVTLANILAVVDAVISATPPGIPPDASTPLSADLRGSIPISKEGISPSRLSSAYLLAQQGLLPFDSNLPTRCLVSSEPSSRDDQLLSNLLTRLRPEFDCQVCYCLYHSPSTTSCGHTFCGSCLDRVRDNSNLCPFCRRSLSSYSNITERGGNNRLTKLVSTLYPDAVAAREAQAATDIPTGGHKVPIFACAMAFPQMPMFLHIFEPRYRLMLRRAIADGTRSFGMVSHRRGNTSSADGEFDASFTRYGTMLHITNLQMFPDGRSLVETVGTYRFKIMSYSWQDGYPVAEIERVEDISYAEEEAMEATERTLNTHTGDPALNWAHMSTQELYQRGIDFVNSTKNNSSGWFANRILDTYGQPPRDPALFPFWIATLLPVHEREKYLVLVSTSVRERLKLVMVWIRAMEQRSWLSAGGLGGSCIVS